MRKVHHQYRRKQQYCRVCPSPWIGAAGPVYRHCRRACCFAGLAGSQLPNTCTHVTAAQHVLYIDARARQQYYRHYALAPKVSAVDLVSS